MLDGDLTPAPWRDVTPEIAATTLWHYGHQGPDRFSMEPGEWRSCLLDLIRKSDVNNRLQLLRVYPGEVIACELAEGTGEGVRALDTIARKMQRSAT